MKSLTSIEELLQNWPELKECINSLSVSKSSTTSVEGIQGSFFSYFTKAFSEASHFKTLQATQYSASSKSSPSYEVLSSDLVIVVPTEHEANNIYSDLQTLYPEAQVYNFPTWGMVPYRGAAKGSVVFGKRAGVLSSLIFGNDKITFKGKPRTCDLYKQTEFIHQSIYRGLLLCKNKKEQQECCELLSQLINLTTSLQGSRGGPLTSDAYLDIISEFSGNDFILSKYENVELRNGLYDYSTKHYFDLCFYLLKDNKFDEGIKAFNNGIRTFLSNGNHKDRNLSNLLDCANIYNARFNSLDNDFWFDLYDMAIVKTIKIINEVDKVIDSTIDNISNCNFTINPKNYNNTNISCAYCKYRDLCFVREDDVVYIEEGESND